MFTGVTHTFASVLTVVIPDVEEEPWTSAVTASPKSRQGRAHLSRYPHRVVRGQQNKGHLHGGRQGARQCRNQKYIGYPSLSVGMAP